MEKSKSIPAEQGDPPGFKPTRFINDVDYFYRIDTVRGLVKRTPLSPDTGEGSLFFRTASCRSLVTRSLAPEPKPKRVKSKRKLSWRVLSTVCTVLFMGGGVLVAYPLYPGVQYEVNQKIGVPAPVSQAAAEAEPISQTNVLSIPKIGVKTSILDSPSLKILDKQEGVWHQTGGIDNNFVLAGHRWKYLPPNTSTFYNLNKLEPGDIIVVDWLKHRYIYVVKSVSVVGKKQTEVIMPTPERQLTLYTCSDKKERERIVVVATPFD